MEFFSSSFFKFFVAVYAVLFVLNSVGKSEGWRTLFLKCNKPFLLGSSYYFYAHWDYRFLSLIIISTLVDYFAGNCIYETENLKRKRIFLGLSLFINLGILFFFKYFNFFIDSANLALSNLNTPLPNLEIILPIGISFYTFQSMSYSLDIYRGELKPAESFIDFAVFVAFFPQLLAGPIMRAKEFLPQLSNRVNLTSENFVKGLQIFLLGLFLKVVVADSIALQIDDIFKTPQNYGPIVTWVAVLGFSFQIFCDFWGYTEMAIGVGLALGFVLPVNFRLPYLATNLFDFWRRWHISLSSFLRDYLYIPLGGNRLGTVRTCSNVFITMLLGGLWHGASWTFVIWGALHGFGLLVARILGSLLKNVPSNLVLVFFKWLTTFVFVCFGWVFFRSDNLQIAEQIFTNLFFLNASEVNWNYLTIEHLFFIPVMAIVHLLFYWKKVDHLFFEKGSFLCFFYIIFLIITVFVFYPMESVPFIYFQF
jgi:alginate O-acetyltransferase complex protein AlgI